jgi:hypothetical protein
MLHTETKTIEILQLNKTKKDPAVVAGSTKGVV